MRRTLLAAVLTLTACGQAGQNSETIQPRLEASGLIDPEAINPRIDVGLSSDLYQHYVTLCQQKDSSQCVNAPAYEPSRVYLALVSCCAPGFDALTLQEVERSDSANVGAVDTAHVVHKSTYGCGFPDVVQPPVGLVQIFSWPAASGHTLIDEQLQESQCGS